MTNEIVTNISLKSRHLQEIKSVLGFKPKVRKTRDKIQPKYNPYFASYWGDFNWLRSLFTGKKKSRCYVTTQNQLRKAGIKKHIGMYDLTDNDGVLDFYIGLPKKLDKRAKKNGFKSNLAWLFCHEWAHGMEQKTGPDRVHAMQKQGKLKELLKEWV